MRGLVNLAPSGAAGIGSSSPSAAIQGGWPGNCRIMPTTLATTISATITAAARGYVREIFAATQPPANAPTTQATTTNAFAAAGCAAMIADRSSVTIGFRPGGGG